MVKFRQPIRQGQSGSDVVAVKRAMQRMHVAGSGAMIVTGPHRRFAGHSFTACIRTVERRHTIHQDGVYGEHVHAVVAPHFTAYERQLYQHATIRRPPKPPPPTTGPAAARRLLVLAGEKKYRDDRGTELAQIRAAADGKPVWSPEGRWVHLDARVLEVLVWLIDVRGYRIGTFALCSDHHDDGPHGHAGGLAVDISSIDGEPVTATGVKPTLLKLLHDLHGAGTLRPVQLISGGYANHRDSDCSALSLPAADSFYGGDVMAEHCNHVHVGYR